MCDIWFLFSAPGNPGLLLYAALIVSKAGLIQNIVRQMMMRGGFTRLIWEGQLLVWPSSSSDIRSSNWHHTIYCHPKPQIHQEFCVWIWWPWNSCNKKCWRQEEEVVLHWNFTCSSIAFRLWGGRPRFNLWNELPCFDPYTCPLNEITSNESWNTCSWPPSNRWSTRSGRESLLGLSRLYLRICLRRWWISTYYFVSLEIYSSIFI